MSATSKSPTFAHYFKVYVAIDFGTDGTGLAYSLPNKNEVYIHSKWKKWNSSNKYGSNWEISSIKPKTAILLDRNGNFKAFGDNALQMYLLLKDKELMLFEHFKMALYTKPHYNQNNDDQKQPNVKAQIVDNLTAMNKKQYPASKVFIEALKFLKQECFHSFRRNKLKIKKISEVCWILSVPAIWDDIAKAKMLKWATAAGMVDKNIDNHLLLRYEPDCASLSIQCEIIGLCPPQLSPISHSQISNITDDPIDNDQKSNDKPILKKRKFLKNEKYIIIDAGGGTVDIACHQILDNHSVKELLHPSGGAWGDMYIDEYFIEIMGKIFETEWLQEFKEEAPNSYLALLDNFRRAKWMFDDLPNKQYHFVNLPIDFLEFMDAKLDEIDDCDEDSEERVNNFIFNGEANCFNLDAEFFKIHYKIWKNEFFDKLINPTIEICKKLLSHNNMKNTRYLCIVGGFGAIQYFQKRLKSAFGRKSKYKLDVIIPARPMLSVLDGAARMTKNKFYVKERVIARTYGDFVKKDLSDEELIGCPNDWKQKNHVFGAIYRQVFKPWCLINETVKCNDKAKEFHFCRSSSKQKKIPFCIYATDKEHKWWLAKKELICLIEDKLEFPDDTDELCADFELFFGETTISIFGQVRGIPGTRKKLEVTCQWK